jgi:5-hydroxyisourate hydrolase
MMTMSPITTHILDTSRGLPAAGVRVILDRQTGPQSWTEVASGATNADGRIVDLLPDAANFTAGVYRLRFATGAYFQSWGGPCFFPEVQIFFQVDDPRGHWHIPLLLSPYGYTTYRGT